MFWFHLKVFFLFLGACRTT